MAALARRLVAVLGFLVVWEAISLSGVVPSEYFPGVAQIGEALWQLLLSGELIHAEWLTLSRAMFGLLLSTALGAGLALLGTRLAVVRHALAPLVDIFQALPPAALVPLMIFVLGFGTPFFLFIICFSAIWPVYLAAIRALTSTEPIQVHSGSSLGYSKIEILWAIKVPAAMPEIFTGIRISAGICLIATVASEMLAGRNGIGYLLFDTAFSLRVNETFAVLAVAAMDGILINWLVVVARRLLIPWHEKLAMSA